MNSRRRFFRDLGIAGTFLVLPKLSAAPVVAKDDFSSVKDDRAYWLKMLERVAGPVLSSLAAGKLRERMPVECPAGDVAGRRKVTHLEAIGRTLSGIAPWLELADKTAEEAELERHFADFARRGLAQATDPAIAGLHQLHRRRTVSGGCGVSVSCFFAVAGWALGKIGEADAGMAGDGIEINPQPQARPEQLAAFSRDDRNLSRQHRRSLAAATH